MSATVVSCYYQLNESKHSKEEYMSWIVQFLVNIDTPIVMFSDGEEYTFMCEIRKMANLSEKFFPIRKPLSELEFSNPEWIEIWTKQVEKSSYKHLHNQELFRIWANKSFFVKEAMDLNPFNSETFVWCDAGCWRDPRIARYYGKGWPCVESFQPGRLVLLTMADLDPLFEKLNDTSIQTLDDVVTRIPTHNLLTFSGSIFAGDKKAWKTWIPQYKKVLETFIKHDLFAGDDQSVIASTVLWIAKTNPTEVPNIFLAPAGNGFVEKEGQRMGDHWFALQIFLSQEFKNRIH